MFLVTTANQQFWKTDGEILFLGEWCRLHEQKSVWSKLNHEVLPWHWQDRAKLIRNTQYIQELQNKVLSILAPKLNELHGVNHSNRYWRIILGAWLFYFTAGFYDRYSSIQTALDSQKITNTWIPSDDLAQFVPEDFTTFENWLGQDSYNFLIYSWIIKQIKIIPFEIYSNVEKPFFLRQSSSNKIITWKTIAKNILERYSRYVPDRFNQIVFFGTYLKPWSLACLQLSLGQLPYLVGPEVATSQKQINRESRNKLELSFAKNSFETLLEKIIPLQIPIIYVEGYSEMHGKAMKAFPLSPKLIFSSIGLYFHEGFKFWAAEMAEQGIKLVYSQHGGHYGNCLISTREDHEIACSDYFISWGWNKENTSKVFPLPSGKLTETCQPINSKPTGNILFIEHDMFIQSKSILSAPFGPAFLDQLNDNHCFVKKLSPEAKELLFIRLPHFIRGELLKRWKTFDPSIRLYRGKESIFNQMKKSRLIVIPYNSTAHLEALAANFPTLIFWRPELNELRPSAQNDHELLYKVGVFHKSPESAANKINQIYQDPLSWWLSPEIQKAREKYCLRYAWTNKNWRATWKTELLKIAGKD